MLYIVGTPIGNLKEITNYAIEILNSCDYILCEDTRTSLVLLKHYNIFKPLFSYHKFNEKEKLNIVIEDLKQNKNIALISDAGMPCISDPGNILINEIILNGLDYTVISGPCALINAFILSGFSAPFTFLGFLPEKEKLKQEILNDVKNYKSSLIFYVSCHDVEKIVESLFLALGNRRACAVREISKLHEEVKFFSLSDGYLGEKRGEFVLVVDKPSEINELNNLTITDHLNHYLNLGFNKNEACKIVSKERKIKKDDVYKIALKL